MGTTSIGKRRRCFGVTIVTAVSLLAMIASGVGAAHLTGPDATYTEEADFLEGTLINLGIESDPTNHHLKLLDSGEAFNFIWVAASQRGTVVKIDTETGDVLGEYRTAPDGMGADPSRTTVDANGNVWVANRAESSSINGVEHGSVTMVGLEENGQCGPSPNTSTGLGDILPWTNVGGADTEGGVSTAEDDCVRHYVRIPGTHARTVAIDANNDVWTGGFSNQVHAKVDSDTGTIVPGTEFNLGCGGYGGLVDPNGILWSASGGWSGVLRYDPATDTGVCLTTVPGNYGLGIDPNTGHIWVSELGGSQHVFELDPADGSVLNSYPQGFPAQGVTVDTNSHVWVAELFGSNVAHFAPDPVNQGQHTFVGNVSGFNGTTGVAVDAVGKVWASEIDADSASRIDPSIGPAGGGGYPIGQIDLTTSLGSGAGPYNYSDMTGSTLTAAPTTGTWRVVHDSGQSDTEWGVITWNDEPEGDTSGDSQLIVAARSSNDGVAWSAWESVSYGVDLTAPDGQYLEVRVTFIRGSDGESPTLSDLRIRADVEEPFLDGFMTGGGSVFTEDDVRVTHGFRLECDASQGPNNLQVNWGRGNRFHLKDLTSAMCILDPTIDAAPPNASFNTYQGEGTGRYNNTPGATATWYFTDAGEPGVDDLVRLMIEDADGNVVLQVSGPVDRGNHQAHDKN